MYLRCSQCKPSYKLVDNVCVVCDNPPHCDTPDSSDCILINSTMTQKCSSCAPGYQLSGGECTKCPSQPFCENDSHSVPCVGDEEGSLELSCLACSLRYAPVMGICTPCTEQGKCKKDNSLLELPCLRVDGEIKLGCNSCEAGYMSVDGLCTFCPHQTTCNDTVSLIVPCVKLGSNILQSCVSCRSPNIAVNGVCIESNPCLTGVTCEDVCFNTEPGNYTCFCAKPNSILSDDAHSCTCAPGYYKNMQGDCISICEMENPCGDYAYCSWDVPF
eukprot:TRINITY_DN1912_c0_g1_i14.p1 TRINITY_DN1912_c0_g1~~TRINITY_DN1912_c0_g1_i14.p1  ORF type:complete len:273 (-),score=20.72 TRINITY_DN1912_c0_g1_i14:31-849(-)